MSPEKPSPDLTGPQLWGLTGGIASGKSQAAQAFIELGIPVIDADRISRELSAAGGEAYARIQRRFGTADRAKLREIVFGDAAARKDLEAILHPLIQQESLRRVQALARACEDPSQLHVIYEAALLVETGRYRELAGLIVIDAPRALRRERLIARDHLAPELADRILATQISDDERRAAAQVILPNQGSIAELHTRIQAWTKSMGWKI